MLNHACSSVEEAEVIAEIVLELDGDDAETNANQCTSCAFWTKRDDVVENLVDNLGIEKDEAKNIIQQLKNKTTNADDEGEQTDDSDEEESTQSQENNNEDDGLGYLVDGECELCDRYINLTKHHLIPKSTWPRMQTKLLHAAEANEKGDREKALLILGPGLLDLLEGTQSGYRFVLSSDKAVVRAILHDTCDICRQCHTTVHATHNNMELALHYNTVEKLLEDERISKFCKWASRQKTGKYRRGS